MEDKFKFWQKWFWVGVIAAFLSPPVGLVYGLALLAEPEHRKEGLALTAWSLVLATATIAFILSIRK